MLSLFDKVLFKKKKTSIWMEGKYVDPFVLRSASSWIAVKEIVKFKTKLYCQTLFLSIHQAYIAANGKRRCECLVAIRSSHSVCFLSSSSRCSRHPDPGAGPRHLIGRLGQQQFPGADLPPHPPDFNVSQRRRVAAGGRQERRHQPDWVGGVPHGNVRRHRANHRP